MQTGHLCPRPRRCGPGPEPWLWPPGGAPDLFLQTEPRPATNWVVNRGSRIHFSASTQPGPLGQGLVLEVLSRAGTLHLQTPVPILSLRARVTTQHLSPPAQRCVSSKSPLGSFLSSPCRGQWGLSVLAPSILGRPLILWGSGLFVPPRHPRSVSGAPTALVSCCLSLYIFLIFCLRVSVSVSLTPSPPKR